MAISAPASITVSNVIRGEEVTISWSAVPDALGYVVERSLNGAAFGNIPQYDISNTAGTYLTFTVGEDWNTVQYRVQAFHYEGAYLVYSDWTTSPVITVEQDGAENPPAPALITVGEYVKGQPLSISWSPVTFSEEIIYMLQASHDGDTFMTCYEGPNTSYVSNISQSVNSVQYRVMTEVKSDYKRRSGWTVSEVKTAGTVTPPAPDTGGGRLEQFQNNEGEDIYPRTVLEGIFRKSDGKSLEELLTALTNSLPDLDLPLSIQNGGTGFDTAEYGLAALIKNLNTSFASTPYTDIYLPVCVGDKSYKVPFTSIQKWTVGDRGSSASQENTSYSSFVARGIAAGTTDYTAGTTTMTSGTIYLVYE